MDFIVFTLGISNTLVGDEEGEISEFDQEEPTLVQSIFCI